MTVNGLRLPDALAELIDSPEPLTEWVLKGGDLAWVYKGGEGGLYWTPTSDANPGELCFSLYLFKSLAEIEEATNKLPVTFHVARYTAEEIAEWDAEYAHLPGFLPFISGFSRVVYFCENGMAEALCFDYRQNPDEPGVIHWDDDHWFRFAPNFDYFISMFEPFGPQHRG